MIKYSIITNKGLKNEINEDSVSFNNLQFSKCDKESKGTIIFSNHLNCAVFDGVGGEGCGDIASNIASKELCKHNKDIYDSFKSVTDLVNSLHQTINKSKEELNKNFYSTFAGVFISKSKIIFSNVGDSPIYLFKNGKISKKYTCDTYEQKLLSEGHSIEEIEAMGIKHVITNCLGNERFSETPIHLFLENRSKDEIILIMSDGISDLVSITELENVLNEEDNVYVISKKIENMVLKRGAHDNYSLIIISL